MKLLVSIFLMKINFVAKSKVAGLRKRSPKALILIEMGRWIQEWGGMGGGEVEVKLHRTVGEMKRKGQKGRGNNVQGKNFFEILGISPCSGTCKGTEIIKAAAKGWKSAPLWVSGVQAPGQGTAQHREGPAETPGQRGSCTLRRNKSSQAVQSWSIPGLCTQHRR